MSKHIIVLYLFSAKQTQEARKDEHRQGQENYNQSFQVLL